MIYCHVTCQSDINTLKKRKSRDPFYLAGTFLSHLELTITFSHVQLFVFFTYRMMRLGKLGLKIPWQILISTSWGKEDGYSTNHYVQFMKEVKVI